VKPVLKRYDVAIIGGGVIGSSIAYHLAKRGIKAIVLEKGRLADQSSGAAAGMLGAQIEMGAETGPLSILARLSRGMFPEIAEELRETSGIDIGLIRKGTMRVVHRQEQIPHFQEVIAAQLSIGEKAEWLSAEETRMREPGLDPHLVGSMYIAEDGHVLAPELSRAFAKSAAVLGAEIREDIDVKSILSEDGKIKGVLTNEGTIDCDHVIVATGAWTGALVEPLGSLLPVYPVKGECFSVVSSVPLLQATVFADGCYLVPKPGGRLIVGATVKEGTYDRKVSLQGIFGLMEKAKEVLPGIADAEWEKTWAGIRPQTIDGLPYLGEHPECAGLFLAAGHYRNGILLSPITGKIMADLIERKIPEEIHLEPFRLDRTISV
jgi:glycine oxidase